jgi:uncharacterized protein YlaI
MKTLFKTYNCGACEEDITLFTLDRFGDQVLEEIHTFVCPHCDATIRTPHSELELRSMWWVLWRSINDAADTDDNRGHVQMLYDHAARRGWLLEKSRAQTRRVFWRMTTNKDSKK